MRDRSQRVFLIAVAGHDNDFRMWRELQRLGKCRQPFFDAFRFRRQTKVLQNHGGLVAAEFGDRGLTIFGRVHVIALKTPLELLQETGVVLND